MTLVGIIYLHKEICMEEWYAVVQRMIRNISEQTQNNQTVPSVYNTSLTFENWKSNPDAS